jgi:hypothetical protein
MLIPDETAMRAAILHPAPGDLASSASEAAV